MKKFRQNYFETWQKPSGECQGFQTTISRCSIHLMKMKSHIAASLINHLKSEQRALMARVRELQESLESESKSSAGDKHETGRAMIHQELSQVGETLDRCNRHLAEIKKWSGLVARPTRVASHVLVVTNGPQVLIGWPLGKIKCDEGDVFAMSADAPLAKSWRGAQVGDMVNVAGQSWTIEALY